MSQSLFEPTWESLKRYQVPQWYENAKLGVFVHWGIYSVPAFDNEWYSRNMYQPGSVAFEHHRKTWGDQTVFGYKDFIPHFTGKHFDAEAWLTLFRRAGARYLVPVAEHHDGFAMYDSALNGWNAARMGPRRDVLGELKQAADAHGLKFGLSNHHAENWWFFDGGRRFPSDVQDPRNAGLYGPAVQSPNAFKFPSPEWDRTDWQPRPSAEYLDDWLARCREQVEKFEPKLFYFDWWIEQQVFEPYLREFTAYYYNRVPDGVLTYKRSTFPEGTAVYDVERGKLGGIRAMHWQTDTSLSYKSWCHIEDDEFKKPVTLIHDLADIVSKNGNLLINVGPRADGTIPDEAQYLLGELGSWLDCNGEAIYDTRVWERFGEGDTAQAAGDFRERDYQPYTPQDIRFTVKDGALYAIMLGWPGTTALVRSLTPEVLPAGRIEQVQMLGSGAPLNWSQDESGLTVEMPVLPPCDYAYTLKISLD
jgi:alpha-L-fucosidase